MNGTVLIPTFPDATGAGPAQSSMAHGQGGAVLVMALVILVVLTILGVSVMNTSSLEALMAGSTQESNRAFQIAESGLQRSYTDGTVYETLAGSPVGSAPVTSVFSYTTDLATATISSTYIFKGDRPRRSLNSNNIYSAVNNGTANFSQSGTSTLSTNARSQLVLGVSQITPK